MSNQLPLVASFGRRHGRKLTPRKARLLHGLLPQLAVPVEGAGRLDVASLFGRDGELWMEIGFGGGEHLAAQAERNPQVNFIGCEPFVNGMASMLGHVEEKKLTNVRLLMDDARLLLDKLPDASLDRLFVLFPDPWPKERQKKRRIISPATLDRMARVMKPGARLRMATDIADYARWMLMYTLDHPAFEWQARCAVDFNVPPADWVTTRYETKTRGEGRKPVFLEFVRK
ncbi:MAG: tRNA (guanosine(46)-N7)-methyltransferase TrmB [Alphaproteobacteria bacterium]|nr:tRNA (guanosine(46)-N7)-methyltransferase TrmB [Alphaproteobacteria bacterium]